MKERRAKGICVQQSNAKNDSKKKYAKKRNKMKCNFKEIKIQAIWMRACNGSSIYAVCVCVCEL